MTINRRQFIKMSSGFFLVPFLTSCDPVKPLIIASHVWPGYDLMFLAQKQGWQTDPNLQLLTSLSATDSISMLSSGQVDGAALTLDEVLLARAKGISLTIVLVFDISAGADVVLSRTPLTKLSDIKGKRIGVETTALGALMLHKLLEAADLEQNNVTVINLDINEQLEAWEKNQIDILISYEPVAGKILATGATSIFDSRQVPDTIFDVLAIRSDVIEQYENALKSLISAHFKTLQYFRHNALDASYRMAKRMQLTGPETLKTFRGLELPSLNANRRYLSNNQNRLLQATQLLSSIMLDKKIISQEGSLENLFTNKYLPND